MRYIRNTIDSPRCGVVEKTNPIIKVPSHMSLKEKISVYRGSTKGSDRHDSLTQWWRITRARFLKVCSTEQKSHSLLRSNRTGNIPHKWRRERIVGRGSINILDTNLQRRREDKIFGV
ncbi:hypothetical protein AVEN_174056-1 [Araneus ventricosus]|uniref:Uncharacterized protein n=1 Tax=Araneus ventricosus TaxID=182803 RepID=A0A4Y2C2B2_ARAVE|nr:hypothetical protein AVEN_174056-1 [Araneus ventricosus]